MYSATSTTALSTALRPTALVRINRAILVLLMTAGGTLGVSPYLILVERPSSLYVVAALLAAVSGFILFNPKERSLARPGGTELLLAAVYAASIGATVAVVSIAPYWITYWLATAITWATSARIDRTSFAFWVSVVVFIVSGPANAVLLVRVLSRQLYPRTVGLPSAFESLVIFRPVFSWLLIMATLIVALLEIVLLQLFPGMGQSLLFGLVLSYALVSIGVPLQQVGSLKSERPGSTKPVKAVQMMFEDAGYKVTPSPRTGNEEIDPLLVDAPDLLAATTSRAFAVEVATDSEGEESLKSKLADLSSASWALDDFQKKDPGSDAGRVQPLLFYIGHDLPIIAKIYESRGNLRVVQLRDAGLLKGFQKSDEEARRELAVSVLSPLTSESAARATS